jgi:hypothetical protein
VADTLLPLTDGSMEKNRVIGATGSKILNQKAND